MTYVEGASLHQERAGSTVFARYAFNELVSFIAGWAILLDYMILIAVTAFSATNYLAAFWGPLGHGSLEIVLALGIVVYVAVAQRPRLLQDARQPGRGAGDRRHRPAAAADRRRAGDVLPLGHARRPDPPRHDADVGRRGLRARRRDGRLHRPGVGVGPVGRGRASPRRAEAPDRLGHRRRHGRLRRHRGRGDDRAAGRGRQDRAVVGGAPRGAGAGDRRGVRHRRG